MLSEVLKHALAAYDEYERAAEPGDDTSASYHLAEAVRELLNEPTNVQALALARLMRDRPAAAQVVVHRDVFDLPNGYWLAIIGLDGFQCGIAPDGSVSS